MVEIPYGTWCQYISSAFEVFAAHFVKISRSWCCEASSNLANRARSIQPGREH